MASLPLPARQQDAVRAFLRRAVPERWRTQTEAGKALGVSQEYFSQLKNGHKEIGPSVALKIAQAAGVSLESILNGSGTHVEHVPRQRSITPTPIPSSRIRYGDPSPANPQPPNRVRALDMLVSRGYDREVVDAEMSLAALDAGIAVSQDMPISWWIDTVRGRIAGLG